jgi:hypothetical protein
MVGSSRDTNFTNYHEFKQAFRISHVGMELQARVRCGRGEGQAKEKEKARTVTELLAAGKR